MRNSAAKPVLLTGGAGFIGTNLARSFLDRGEPVHIFDNLSRAGVDRNVCDLQRDYSPQLVHVTIGDVRDSAKVATAVLGASAVFHLAAQVAVTSSLDDPIADAHTNLLGTLNVLEAIRKAPHQPPILFTSTNKVYGRLEGVALRELTDRWEPAEQRLANCGIDESQRLEFLSPYGCSKGAADQYVLDYAHSFGLKATVFRMSCIYGPYQLGSEDQGWVAHFVRQGMKHEPITIYGDGKQVRDLLFVNDLTAAMRLAIGNIERISGQAFNLGGGVSNSISLLLLLQQLEILAAPRIRVEWGPERLADQKWYVADCRKLGRALGWSPRISIPDGLAQLVDWYTRRPSLINRTEAQVA